ncbi:nuclear transport factor 2 family protein [Cellvibrio sp.]|uniref:nuclear transport factor 2 family protein n=1 Tax=Cellvibrio sp. TaxID=1965322 RepID=UPI0039647659
MKMCLPLKSGIQSSSSSQGGNGGTSKPSIALAILYSLRSLKIAPRGSPATSSAGFSARQSRLTGAGDKLKATDFALAIFIYLCAYAAHAQVPVAANADHKAMLASTDPQLAANKILAYDFWRSFIEAGHVELAAQYMTETYIQHNPNIGTGRAALVDYFSRGTLKDIAEEIKGPLVSIVAEGDLVVLTWAQAHQDPIDRSKFYTTTGMDMFRIENGKLAEHWDGAPKISTPSQQIAQINKERKELILNNDTLKKYAGLYQLTPDFQLLIKHENNQLIAQGTGGAPIALHADSTTSFFIKEAEIQIDFLLGEQNQTTQLVMHRNGRDFYYVKLADQF